MRRVRVILERREIVNGKPATIHVYEPKPHKDEQVMAARDDSRKPWSKYKQWEHAR